jgi:hypothetical protein
MRTFAALFAGLSIGLGVAQASAAQEVRSINRLEARALPERDLRRQVLQQLGDVLLSEPAPRPKGPGRPLAELSFYTRPYATQTAGVCQTDSVAIAFRPTDTVTYDASTPTHAAGVSAQPMFRVTRALDPRQIGDLQRGDIPDADASCARLDPRKTHFFSAQNEDSAVRGLWLVRAVARQARDDRPGLEPDCAGYRGDCRLLLAALDQDRVVAIRPCGRPAPNHACVAVEAENWVNIEITQPYGPSQGPLAVIVRQELVIVAPVAG